MIFPPFWSASVVSFNQSYGFQRSDSLWTLTNQQKTASITHVSSGNFQQNLTGVALSGKTYWEMEVVSVDSASLGPGLGVSIATGASWNTSPSCYVIFGAGACGANPGLMFNGSASTDPFLYTVADRIGIAYDAATRKIWFRKNGVWSGDPAAGTGEAATLSSNTYYPATSIYSCYESRSGTVTIYPGSNEFAGSVPSGFSPYYPDP